MSTRIQVRRGTSTQWTAAQTALGSTPILVQGEIGFETETGHFKIGDGTSLWSTLPYVYESFAFGPTFTDQVVFATTSDTLAPIKLPSGLLDKTTPVAGDLWVTNNTLKYYTGSATKSFAYLDSTMSGVWNGTAVAGQYGGTGVANTGKTITLGGNLTTSGAYATTLTVTAATSVTLPTSGTLMANPMTTFGDIIVGGSSPAGGPTRLAGPSTATSGTSFLYQSVGGGSIVASGWQLGSSAASNSTVATRDSAGNLGSTTFNLLSLTANTTGFSLAGGSVTSKTLTVNNSYTLSGSDVTVSLAGNLTTSGAFATTLTTTAATSVTLPTTGTLVANTHATLTAGTTAMALATNSSVIVTPNATATYTSTVPAAGLRATVIILTSGTTSYTITFGTGFKPSATLATGTTTAKYWTVNFISDGTNLIETGRTGPL